MESLPWVYYYETGITKVLPNFPYRWCKEAMYIQSVCFQLHIALCVLYNIWIWGIKDTGDNLAKHYHKPDSPSAKCSFRMPVNTTHQKPFAFS